MRFRRGSARNCLRYYTQKSRLAVSAHRAATNRWDKESKMGTVTSILLGLLGVLVLGAVVWRLASGRRSIPCPAWLSWMVELDNPFTKTNRAATIVERLDLRPGMAVLDVGCGPGRLTIPIATKVGSTGEVVAMDIQSGMLQRAREKARAANLTNIEFLQAGVGEGKLGRNRFDRAVLVTVLGEIPNRDAAMREIRDRSYFRSAFPVAPDRCTPRAYRRLPGKGLPRQCHRIRAESREARGLTASRISLAHTRRHAGLVAPFTLSKHLDK